MEKKNDCCTVLIGYSLWWQGWRVLGGVHGSCDAHTAVKHPARVFCKKMMLAAALRWKKSRSGGGF